MIEYNQNTVLAYNKQKNEKQRRIKTKNKTKNPVNFHGIINKTAKNDDKTRSVANSSIQKVKKKNKETKHTYNITPKL